METSQEAYEATLDAMCGRSITLGPVHDPYGATCELPRNHDGPHESPDPFGRDEPLRWSGGGRCAGDPLPFRVVAS